jgi:hypothetical protein
LGEGAGRVEQACRFQGQQGATGEIIIGRRAK